MPSLDGIRGIALVAVLLFHSQFSWAKGGYLGVTTFFVLSGFLITGLLLRERDTTGAIGLRSFWERRARRLAPAVIVLLALVVAYVAFGTPRPPAGVFGDALASSTWVANWRFVLSGHSYGDLFSTPSPFQHMWSLAVEEQVYLLLPITALLLLGRGRATPNRRRLAIGLALLAIGSTVTMALLHHPGALPLHEYYGTDARAAEPVVGALLAVALVGRGGLRQLGRRARIALDWAGLAALVGLVAMCGLASERADVMYHGGFLAAAVLSATLIAAATQPGGAIAGVFAFEPLVGLGRISYGAYLFHWPIFLWLTAQRTGLNAPRLLLLRVLATLTLSIISYFAIEMPVRTGRLSLRIGVPAWANASVGLLAALALVTMEASTGAGITLGGALEPPPVPTPAAAATRRASGPAPRVVLSATPANAPAGNRPAPAQNEMTNDPDPAQAPPAWDGTGKRPLRVAFVGDSMAANLANGMKQWASGRSDVITYSVATLGCPLSRGGTRRSPTGDDWHVTKECEWWADPSSQRSQYLAAFAPDVIVIQDAMNELPDRKLPEWSDYRHTGEPSFDQWLLSEYNALLDTIAKDRTKTKVIFLNAVCVDWQLLGRGYQYYADNGDGDRRVASLRAGAGALASSGAKVEDYFSQLCPNGSFTQTIYGVQNARPDGYHLSDDAARAVAEHWLGPLVLDTANGVLPAQK